MLTRAQIQRLAQRHRIGMQVQERDYLQHLLLSLLYTRSQALIFKGGTALRLTMKGNRYSEDLGLAHLSPSQITRLIARLRVHGIIKKVAKGYKYYLTDLGRQLTCRALKLREMVIIPELALPVTSQA